MPQPLSSLVSGKIPVKWDPAVGKRHPILASLALEVIACASVAEANFARLAATLTHGRAKPVVDYYLSLRNDAPKAAVVEALAASTLEPDRLEAFRALAKFHLTSMTARQPIAHWVWGETEKLPDALLLIDPRDLLANVALLDPITTNARDAYRAQDIGAMQKAADDAQALRAALGPYVMVYREKDFAVIIRDIRRSNELIDAFHSVHQWDLIQQGRGDEEFLQLVQQPELRTLIEARRQSEKGPGGGK